MRARPRLVFTLLFASVALAGCAGLLRSAVARPSVSVRDARLSSLSFQGADLQFDLAVSNPNRFGLRLGGLEYALNVEGASVLRGRQDASLALEPNATSSLSLPVTLRYADLWKALTQVVSRRDTDYTLEATLAFDLPAGQTLRVPLRHTGKVPVLRMPKVRLDHLSLRDVGLQGADLAVALAVENPNDVPAILDGLDYGLELSGTPIGRARSDARVEVAPNATRTVTIPVRVDLARLGTAVASLLRSGQRVDYRLDGTAEVTAALPAFAPSDLPFEDAGQATVRRE
jgi:LEA14-like dessication related protein